MSDKLELRCDKKLTKFIQNMTAFHKDKDSMECIRHALGLYDVALRNEYKGGLLIIVKPNGTQESIQLID